MRMKFRARLSNEEIKGRLILIVGLAISIAFVGTVFVLLYGLLFVVQPLEQAPNDAEAWKILSPLTLTMSGVLAGLLASNGLKGHQNDKDKE
jgi:H+/Cl- antiporter ClcA